MAVSSTVIRRTWHMLALCLLVYRVGHSFVVVSGQSVTNATSTAVVGGEDAAAGFGNNITGNNNSDSTTAKQNLETISTHLTSSNGEIPADDPTSSSSASNEELAETESTTTEAAEVSNSTSTLASRQKHERSGNSTSPSTPQLLRKLLKIQAQDGESLLSIQHMLENYGKLADAFAEAYDLLMGDADRAGCNVDEMAVGVDKNRRCYYLDGITSYVTYEDALNTCTARGPGSSLARDTDVTTLQRLLQPVLPAGSSKALKSAAERGHIIPSNAWLFTVNTKGKSRSRFINNGAKFGGDCNTLVLTGDGSGSQTAMPCKQVNGFICYRSASGMAPLPQSLYNLVHNVKSTMSSKING